MALPQFDHLIPCETTLVNQGWKKLFQANVRSLDQLAKLLELSEEQKKKLFAQPDFSINIPMRLVLKMEKGKIDDPLFLQFVPFEEEEDEVEGFEFDPLNELSYVRTSKMLHKYPHRALLVTTATCPMHCRYCFRRHFDYDKSKGFSEELEMIAEDTTLEEVILSGGDPLSLNESTLEELLSRIDSIDHVRLIRFHTRFPIGIPERIDDRFCSMIEALKKQVVIVVHTNHPRELDEDHVKAFKKLRKANAMLFNQSVLLRNVNDDIKVLRELCLKLVQMGVTPYYIHQLDRVRGASHFEVPIQEGKRLMVQLQKELPGYALPRYVQEIAGSEHKVPLLF